MRIQTTACEYSAPSAGHRCLRTGMRCSRLILASTLVFLPACASKVQTVAQPIVTPQMRLASADAHMRAGCLDCLENAYREYVALRSDSMVGEAAKQGALRAAVLVAVRKNELGLL